MSNTWAAISMVGMIGIVIFGVSSCSSEMRACEAAGGIAVYEYKAMPSCWARDGRRMFPK